MAEKILEVVDLKVEFRTDRGTVTAVNGVNFEVIKGKTVGVVGESGSGKSVTALSIMRLIPDPPGSTVRPVADVPDRRPARSRPPVRKRKSGRC